MLRNIICLINRNYFLWTATSTHKVRASQLAFPLFQQYEKNHIYKLIFASPEAFRTI